MYPMSAKRNVPGPLAGTISECVSYPCFAFQMPRSNDGGLECGIWKAVRKSEGAPLERPSDTRASN